jgi:hypothetical protein
MFIERETRAMSDVDDPRICGGCERPIAPYAVAHEMARYPYRGGDQCCCDDPRPLEIAPDSSVRDMLGRDIAGILSRPVVIRAEIGTTGDTGEIEITGDHRADVSAAIREEHYCTDDASCDIERARDDGYPLWAARLLQGATECPLLDAVIAHYRARGLDFDTEAELDRDAWLESDTWTRHAYRCSSCGSITFGDESWTPSDCGDCGSGGLTPCALGEIDVDEFVRGYLDGILFTESLDYDPDSPAPRWAQGFSSDCSLLNYGCERESFSTDAVAEIRAECVGFLLGCAADVKRYCELRGTVRCATDSFGRSEYGADECAGTDFWLSRNGHGAGFFDRGDDPVFRRLQDAARVYGETYVYFDGEEITI